MECYFLRYIVKLLIFSKFAKFLFAASATYVRDNAFFPFLYMKPKFRKKYKVESEMANTNKYLTENKELILD